MAATVAALGAAVAALVGPGVADAAPTPGRTATFAAQARQAGLTPVQAAELERKVSALVVTVGGTRVTVNKIAKPGMTVLVAFPGETVAREYNQPVQPAATCNRGYFCTWEDRRYTGTQVNYYYCTPDYQSMPFAHSGSYRNNQTGGAVARFLGEEHQLLYYSQPPPQGVESLNWEPIFYVDPC
jgi:Peptidase inhibitor family I36